MIGSKQRLRIPINVFVALSVAITLTLSSFAAPSLAVPSYHDAAVLPAQVQPAQTGTLTATGSVTVNGNPAATGMTILTGNIISVGGGGHAVIEMGPLGRIEIGQGTTLTLQMLGNVQDASLAQCGSVIVTVPIGVTGRVTIPQPQTASVRVSQGKVTVTYAGGLQKELMAGANDALENVAQVVSDGGAAVFEVCCGCNAPPPLAARILPFSPWWLLLGIPVGLGIGLGITQTGGGPPPVLSPVVPED